MRLRCEITVRQDAAANDYRAVLIPEPGDTWDDVYRYTRACQEAGVLVSLDLATSTPEGTCPINLPRTSAAPST